MTHLPSQRGFTFLEMVITLGIVLVMFTALITFFVSSNSTFFYDKSFIDTASGAGAIVKELAAATLPADAVVSTHSFSTGTYTSGSTALVLEMPSIDSTGAAVSGAYDYEVFYLSGTSVYRRLEASGSSSRKTGTKLLSDQVSSLTFTYDSSDVTQAKKVTVDVQTQATSRGSTLSDHRTVQFVFRNTGS